MSRLPPVRPRALISALQRLGFDVVRVRGSHYQLLHPVSRRRVTVPFHTKELTRSTLASILAQAGLTADDVLRHL